MDRIVCGLAAWLLLGLMLPAGVRGAEEDAPVDASPTRTDLSPRSPQRDRPDERRRPPERNFWRGGRGEFAPRPESRQPIDSGYLFIDGEYVEPPYSIRWNQQALEVNGERTAIAVEQLPRTEHSERGGWGGHRGFEPDTSTLALNQVLTTLHHDNLLMLWEDSAPVALHSYNGGTDILRALTDRATREEMLASDLEAVIANIDRDRLGSWLASFRTPVNLHDRATTQLAALDRVLESNEAQNRAVRRFDQWAYVLTITGMVLVVAAFGHLLSSAPARTGEFPNGHASPEAIRALVWSLSLVAALSALDLIWTVLSSQAGTMRELNPLAREMMHNPYLLMAFKAGVTALALGILLLLRRSRPAQIGAWWACLICTLLTARWLVLHSLMV